MLKSKRVSRIISALLVVMLVASLGITTVSANNHDDTEFTFAFNSASPLSWTAVREKTDSTSMYARISTMDGAYYVVCYGTKASEYKGYGGSGSGLPSHLRNVARYDGDYVRFTFAGESHYISNWVYESKEANESRVWAALAGKTVASYHNVRGVWSPDSV